MATRSLVAGHAAQQSLGRMPRQSLSDRLARRIRELIQQREYKEGDRLPAIMEMARSFGVGHPTVREALKKLEAVGVVEIRHGSGVYVSRSDEVMLLATPDYAPVVTQKLLADLIRSRMPLEMQSVAEAVPHLTARHLKEMRRLLNEAEKHLDDDGVLNKVNMQFHRQIAVASENTVLLQLLDVLREMFQQEQLMILDHLRLAEGGSPRAPGHPRRAGAPGRQSRRGPHAHASPERPGRGTPVGSGTASGALTAAALLACAVASVRAAQVPSPPARQASSGAASSSVVFRNGPGRFRLSAAGASAPIVVSSADFPGVVRAARSVGADVGRVTGHASAVSLDTVPAASEVVVAGTLGRSPLIDSLVRDGSLDTSGVAGRWEAFVTQVVEHPWPGVARALIVAGSDKRGTIYGLYDLSARIGVSPWNWWADVPVRHRPDLFVLPGRRVEGPPAVKYRGIFLNDEAPALAGWARATFGGLNHQFYEKVFELILRLRGNYLWPAMWDNAFNEDDSLDAPLADEYGVVMGTSHHEPMLRAQQEWKRHGTGPWDYQTNAAVLDSFWRQGIRNMDSHESIVTVGMRGDGDLPMSDSANVGLLEQIVADQRRIIAEVTGKPASETPQDWALYKEVQTYYDRGMRVPDDVTLLFADDNWGDVRRLPDVGAPPRSGGYGIYYHFDYVGGPRNYKWINTNSIPRVWEQLHLAYKSGVDRIWIVNVGDLKPMELPIQFFFDYAWDPSRWSAERIPEYTRGWAAQQFGPEQAGAIAAVLADYGRYSARRKPELLTPDTFSMEEWDAVTLEWRRLTTEATRIARALPAADRDAYYELVLHPILALGNLYDLYATVARNRRDAAEGRASTNARADSARALFARDAAITAYYNDTLAGGKWHHMMDQTHIGYTTWQEPPRNVMPDVREATLPDRAEMGVAIAGSDSSWPMDTVRAVLPEFDAYRRPSYDVTVFDRGSAPFDFEATTDAPWLVVTPSRGRVAAERHLRVTVDWSRAPVASTLRRAAITITGTERRVVVYADVRNPAQPRPDRVHGFVEGGGYVSIEAEHFTRAVATPPITWVRIPGLGRTLSGVTPFPVTAPRQTPGASSPHLDYRMYLFGGGEVAVRAIVSPTLDVHAAGLRYAVSFDDQPPQIVNVAADTTLRAWERWVSDNAIMTVTRHRLAGPGEHVLHFWMVDPGVVLQKLVVERGQVRPSYLGAPESFHRP